MNNQNQTANVGWDAYFPGKKKLYRNMILIFAAIGFVFSFI